MTSFTSAHEPVVAAFRENCALPSAHAEVMTLLTDRVRINPDGSARIVDEHGHDALDAQNNYEPLTPEGFVRELKRSRPWIFSTNAKRDAKTVQNSPVAGGTVTELTIAARKGDSAAQAELDRRMYAGSKSAQTPNITQLMAKENSGDADARRQLDAFFSTGRP